MKFKIKVKDTKLIPIKAHDTDAGFDLKAFDFSVYEFNTLRSIVKEKFILPPGARVLVGTGVALALEPGWEAQIRPRSGLALKSGIMIVNSPGTIDCEFRNYIGVILINAGYEDFIINKYDRIAQMVIKEVPKVELEVVDELNTTERNMNGFGSTGKN